LNKKIGEGSFGKCYEATNIANKEKVVVKLFRKSAEVNQLVHTEATPGKRNFSH